jgi:hypothetical protein
VELLRRADVPADDEEVRQLRVFTQPPSTGPSRNSPCACGSGRKYKLCCGARGTAHALADRANWLWTKVASFGRSLSFREQLIRRALEATRYEDDPQATVRGLEDPLVLDALLFEDGVLQRFLDVRGELLPEDERALAETWLTTRLSVYEVTSTRPGSSIHLRDVDGVDTEVRERTASRTLRRGDLLVARLLPTGAGHMLGAVLSLPRKAREHAAAASTAQELYDLVAQLRRPPSLTNTDGHALVPLTQQWLISEAAWAALCEHLEPGEDAEHCLLVRASGQIAASFRRTAADGLSVEVNSRERAKEVMALVGRLDPAAQLLSEEEAVASSISSAPEPPTAEMQAALQEYMQKYEREWCDMEIPALDGRTPREAVRTTEGRAAVEDLLADMPETPNGMSARRVRALLELPTPLR